jgi:two-component system, OmpR family, response regulator MprA
MPRILVADDDPRIAELLRMALASEGYAVAVTLDGETALREARLLRPDLVVLDWLLPRRSGVDVARELHAEGGPAILMLSARGSLEERVAGLDSGADDYLVKPFALPELLARVRALLRRAPPADRPLQYADLTLDLRAHQVWRGRRELALTPTEFSLLTCLLRHPHQALSREQLLTAVWGADFAGNSAILDVYIGHLRRKLEVGGERRLIQTVRGVGYAMRVSV